MAACWTLRTTAGAASNLGCPLLKSHKKEVAMMSKLVCAGLVALVTVGSSSLAHAQASPAGTAREGLSAAELETLTDARISIVKFALQMTPDQEKLWPAVEEAIRSRAAGRQARLAEREARIAELRDRNAIEILQDRNPVDFLRRRADALGQRAAELKPDNHRTAPAVR